MKKYLILLLIFLTFFTQISCSDTDEPEEPIVEDVVLKDPINNFVWRAMNSWYNWKSDVVNLSDTKNENRNDYYTYLNKFPKPGDLFEDLLHDKGNVDRFSWFIEDYVVQNQQFQGVSKSFGFRLQAVQIGNDGDIIFYVRYVAPNSPASNAGIKRGDIINALDNIELNTTNYSSTVGKLSNEMVTLGFVSESGGALTHVEDKTISSVVLSQDPVHFKKVFNNINGKKVGYLVYNGFRSSYNDELNAAFSFFKTEGIDELVLDLRLNGGGSVQTSAYLASMIYAGANSGIFAELNFNSSHTNQNGAYNFGSTLNVYNTDGDKTGDENISRLNTLSQLYVLTSSNTASASEMIINGLKPYIPVKVIGTTTYGKNVGSITLYDSPTSDYTNQSSASTKHKNAMQPIVFQIYNKDGESDYINGFTPDIEIKEWEFWNNILPFGDENEIILKGALDDIKGIVSKSESTLKYKHPKIVDLTELNTRFEKEMYINHEFFGKE